MEFVSNELSKKTIVFGLKLWVVVGIGIGALFVLILFCLSICLTSRKKSLKKKKKKHGLMVSKLPKDLMLDRSRQPPSHRVLNEPNNVLRNAVSNNTGKDKDTDKDVVVTQAQQQERDNDFNRVNNKEPVNRNMHATRQEETRIEMGNRVVRLPPMERGVVEGERRGEPPNNYNNNNNIAHEKGWNASGDSRFIDSPLANISVPEVSHLGWGHWYTLRELEAATDSFSDSNVLGEGGYGIVYLGHLPDGTRIAVKNLLNNRGQAEREFKIEVEAIGRVRHKNLVRLIGYCMEGSQRMLVYEYVDNGNLEQWLHGQLGNHPAMSWDIRMKIILGTAKGLAYLHEGLEPKVVHRDVKSSNILIDSQWNPKVADFGLAKLLGTGNSHVTTRVMGTFGYVAPEYALTGMLTEKSDVYSYGVLLMELVTGRVPVDFGRPAGEVNLVDWLKAMVGNHHSEEVIDSKMEVKPSPRALKRTLLVALRCVDPDAQKRPKMGQVVHMLETDDNPFREDRKNAGREASRQRNVPHNNAMAPMAPENQSIPKEDSSHMAAQLEVDTQKMIQKINKWKGSAQDDEEELGSPSNGDSRARWRR